METKYYVFLNEEKDVATIVSYSENILKKDSVIEKYKIVNL